MTDAPKTAQRNEDPAALCELEVVVVPAPADDVDWQAVLDLLLDAGR